MQVGAKIDRTEEWGVLPETLPPSWSRLRAPQLQAATFRRERPADDRRDRLTVLVSAHVEADGKRWVHVSASKPGRMPTYDDLAEVKRLFIGDERSAYQVFARADEHYNLHETCLHIWACLDGDPLPDFRYPGGGV